MNELMSLPADDRLVETWDALVADQDLATRDADRGTIDTLLVLHRAYQPSSVDHAFLDRLQRQLEQITVSTPSAPEVAPCSESHAGPRSLIESFKQKVANPARPKNMFSYVSIAAVIAVISVGLFVTWAANQHAGSPSGPFPSTDDSIHELRAAFAPPIPELLLDIVVNPAALTGSSVDTDRSVEFGTITVLPGSELSTDHPYFSCCMSALAIQVQQGSGQLTAGENSFIYRSGSSVPDPTSPETTYDLAPGDSILVFTASHAALTNPSLDNLTLLVSRFKITGERAVGAIPPEGLRIQRHIHCLNLNGADGEAINIRFEQVTMNPGALFTVESKAKECLGGWYSIVSGQQARFLPGDASAFGNGEMGHYFGTPFTIHGLSEGPYTILNPASQPITLYLMHTSET